MKNSSISNISRVAPLLDITQSEIYFQIKYATNIRNGIFNSS